MKVSNRANSTKLTRLQFHVQEKAWRLNQVREHSDSALIRWGSPVLHNLHGRQEQPRTPQVPMFSLRDTAHVVLAPHTFN